MVNQVYIWLAVFIALVASLLLTKNEKIKPRIADALLVMATIYVGLHFYQALDPNKPLKSTTTPVIDSDKAELGLKMAQAIQSTSHMWLNTKIVDRHHSTATTPASNAAVSPERQAENLKREAQKILGGLVQKNPAAGILEAKYAIVTHDLDDPNSISLERLSNIDTPNAKSLSKALNIIYGEQKATSKELSETETTINTILPRGWYRDKALIEFYKKAGRKAELQQMLDQEAESGVRLVSRLIIIFGIMVVAFLVGAIVILVQLFLLPRSITREEDRELIASPIKFSVRTIYGVFIAWMVTQVLLSSILQTGVRVSDLMHRGVFLAATTTAVLYFASNGPGLLYIHLIAVKPNNLKFFETVKLRTRVGKLGPLRMVMAGWLTWFAAVPVVLLCYLIAMKLMNSQGSTNPVIALVMEAARSADIASILMFYLTLGVLAPICEETLFRGFLYTSLRRYWGAAPSLLLTAFLFAAVHMDAGGFVPLFGLGLLFGFVVERTKSTLSSMVAHGLWNSGTFTLVLLLFGS